MLRFLILALYRLLAVLALLIQPVTGRADESLTLTANQIKSLQIVSRVLEGSGDGQGASLPAQVLVPTAQMRILAAPVGELLDTAVGEVHQSARARASSSASWALPFC